MRRSTKLCGATLATAFAVSGCTWLGPDIVRSGRPAYNDAILATSDEQLLQNVVRLRFIDSVGFLNVSSVTANVSFTTTAAVQAGFGTKDNYAGNLTPFTGTLSTEQNPTISYSPVSGDHVLQQFGAEIPLDRVVLLIGNAHDPRLAWYAVIRRINSLRNPDFPRPPTLAVDPRFDEVVALASRLQADGMLYWVRLAGAEKGTAMVLHSYSPHDSRDVARLLELLAIRKPEREGDDIVIPVQLSAGAPAPNRVTIETRTLLDLMRLAAARIEVPSDVIGAARMSEPGPAAQGMRIRSAALRPGDVRTAAEYRGRWYYIEIDDDASKQWFQMLQLLASAQLPSAAAGSTPVLTIPVSR